MFFLKPKQKSEDILPPPPPFLAPEFEEETGFSADIEPEKSEIPEYEKIEDLFREESQKPKKEINKEKAVANKAEIYKKPKILKKGIKRQKTSPIKKIIQIKQKKVLSKKENVEESIFPEKIKISESGMELPQELEDFGIENLEKELGIAGGAQTEFAPELEQKAEKPKEMLEAEEEIKSAIEKIKKREKPSFFKNLFAKKKEQIAYEQLAPEIAATNGISAIQNNIKSAREALTRFDLESARKSYIEVMRIYSKIKPEEQAKVYHGIRDLYFERKSAEELKV